MTPFLLERAVFALTGVALLGVGGCAGKDAFNPHAAQVLGVWRVNVDDQPGPGAPSGLVNPCRIRGAPLEVLLAGVDTMAIGQPGGTLQCELNGTWGMPTPYTLFIMTVSYDVGTGQIELRQQNGDLVFTGRVRAANQMEGAIDPGGWGGRVGTWSAQR
jgi:hypothetical protein